MFLLGKGTMGACSLHVVHSGSTSQTRLHKFLNNMNLIMHASYTNFTGLGGAAHKGASQYYLYQRHGCFSLVPRPRGNEADFFYCIAFLY